MVYENSLNHIFDSDREEAREILSGLKEVCKDMYLNSSDSVIVFKLTKGKRTLDYWTYASYILSSEVKQKEEKLNILDVLVLVGKLLRKISEFDIITIKENNSKENISKVTIKFIDKKQQNEN